MGYHSLSLFFSLFPSSSSLLISACPHLSILSIFVLQHRRKYCLTLIFYLMPKFKAIEVSTWEAVKERVQEINQLIKDLFGSAPCLPELLHNVDVCRILNISKRTLQHYRDTSVIPYIQIGHKCYYKPQDIIALLEPSNPLVKRPWNTNSSTKNPLK